MNITTKIQNIKHRLNNASQAFIAPTQVYSNRVYAHHRLAFSQEGEDLILESIFQNKFNGFKTNGFYIDIGAHHPQRFSNTYYFYLKGWKGINIDALPEGMRKFQDLRPRDINLEIPIAEKNQVLTYYEFEEPAFNGFHPLISQERGSSANIKMIGKREIECYRCRGARLRSAKI
jgi:hypothetical protein